MEFEMAVTVKSEHEIQLMREAGEILAKVHEELHAALKPGMTAMRAIPRVSVFRSTRR